MSSLRPHQEHGKDSLRRYIPAATVAASLLFMILPLPLAWAVMPNFALLFLLIWAGIRPDLMPTWAAMSLGLLADIMFGMPIGVWTFLFPLSAVAVRLAVSRVERHNLLVDWSFTGLLLILAHMAAWQLLGFLHQNPAFVPMLVQAGLTILAYPLAAGTAARLQRHLADYEA